MTNFLAALHFMKQVLRLPEDDLLKKHFLEDISYRSDQRNQSNRLVGLLEYRIIRNRKSGFDTTLPETNGLILTSSKPSMKNTQLYIERNLGKDKLSIVYRDDLVYSFKNIFERIGFFLFVMQISMRCFFSSKSRLNQALCIREVMEWARIADLLDQHELRELIDFSGYEKDSNALTAFVQSKGIRVIKVPSPGPLKAHYTYVRANALILSSAYQQEEISSLSATWNVDEFLYWPPEQSHLYDFIYESCEEPRAKTIGFYSHGEWLRRLEGHADPGLDILANEEALLADLSSFLQKHTEYSLVIFPHPKERKSEHTTAYYQEKLKGVPYIFSEEGKPSAQLFHTVDVGLMAYSTLIFERIGMGYKTFIARYTLSVFPVQQSSLNALLFSSAETLEIQLLNTEEESRSKYFERNNLSKHLISNFTRQL